MGERPQAITETLRQRIQAGLHYGTLTAGERLASLREVATEFYTNPRAVMTAYRQLAAEGLVCVRPRSGVFVQGPGRGDYGLDAVPIDTATLAGRRSGLPPAIQGVGLLLTTRFHCEEAEPLPRGWRRGRVVTVPRVFSAETARALLLFLVGQSLQGAQGSRKA